MRLVARGQRVLLYSYDKALRVPDGVELTDANDILPTDHIHEFVHPNGETSPTVHANLFRYEALRHFGGWYCDLDVVLVGDDPPSTEVYLARQDDELVNNAVLRFPPNARLMVDAAEAARDLMTSSLWGASGPNLLTRLVREHGLLHLVAPASSAYPIRPTEVLQMFLPEHREEMQQRVGRADFVHLWNQIWRRVRIPKDLGPPEGSFLDGLFRSVGIRVAPGARMSEQAVRSWFHEYLVLLDAKNASGRVTTIAELAYMLKKTRAELASATADQARRVELTTALDEARRECDEMRESHQTRLAELMAALDDAKRKCDEMRESHQIRLAELMAALDDAKRDRDRTQESHQTRLAQLTVALDDARREGDEMRESHQTRLAELMTALDDAKRERDRMQESHQARLAQLTAALDDARRERDEMHKSTSWRWTAPLRAISQGVRNLIGRQ
jgi:predicted secreted Zn-dependent protease